MYALIALYLFFRARYWESGQLLKPFFIASTIFGTWFFGGLWISMVFLGIHHTNGSSLAGLGYALLTIALGITVWVLVPLYLLFCALFALFVLPGVVRFTLHAPFLLWHYLHYLFVPHPMEKGIKRYERVRLRRRAKIDHAAFAEEIAKAQYDRDQGRIPAWWKSKNWARRLKDILAHREKVKAEKDVADEYAEEFRKNHRRQR